MVGRGPGAFWFPVSLLSVLPDQAVHWGRLCVAPRALRVSRCAGGRGGGSVVSMTRVSPPPPHPPSDPLMSLP